VKAHVALLARSAIRFPSEFSTGVLLVLAVISGVALATAPAAGRGGGIIPLALVLLAGPLICALIAAGNAWAARVYRIGDGKDAPEAPYAEAPSRWRPAVVLLIGLLGSLALVPSLRTPFMTGVVVHHARAVAHDWLALSGTLLVGLVALSVWCSLILLWGAVGGRRPGRRGVTRHAAGLVSLALTACRYAPYPVLVFAWSLCQSPDLFAAVRRQLPVPPSWEAADIVATGQGYVMSFLVLGAAMGLTLGRDLWDRLSDCGREAEQTDMFLLGRLAGCAEWKLRLREVLWLRHRHEVAGLLATLFGQALLIDVWSTLLLGATREAFLVPYPSLGASMIAHWEGVDLGQVVLFAMIAVPAAVALGLPRPPGTTRMNVGDSEDGKALEVTLSSVTGGRERHYRFERSPDYVPGSETVHLVVGPSGAGKSTFLSAVFENRKDVVALPQDPKDLWPRALPLREVTEALESGTAGYLHQLKETMRFEAVAKRVTYTDFPRRMSRGELQRINLTLGLTAGRTLLLDEPTSALDSANANRLVETMGELSDNGLLVATHDHRLLCSTRVEGTQRVYWEVVAPESDDVRGRLVKLEDREGKGCDLVNAAWELQYLLYPDLRPDEEGPADGTTGVPQEVVPTQQESTDTVEQVVPTPEQQEPVPETVRQGATIPEIQSPEEDLAKDHCDWFVGVLSEMRPGNRLEFGLKSASGSETRRVYRSSGATFEVPRGLLFGFRDERHHKRQVRVRPGKRGGVPQIEFVDEKGPPVWVAKGDPCYTDPFAMSESQWCDLCDQSREWLDSFIWNRIRDEGLALLQPRRGDSRAKAVIEECQASEPEDQHRRLKEDLIVPGSPPHLAVKPAFLFPDIPDKTLGRVWRELLASGVEPDCIRVEATEYPDYHDETLMFHRVKRSQAKKVLICRDSRGGEHRIEKDRGSSSETFRWSRPSDAGRSVRVRSIRVTWAVPNCQREGPTPDYVPKPDEMTGPEGALAEVFGKLRSGAAVDVWLDGKREGIVGARVTERPPLTEREDDGKEHRTQWELRDRLGLLYTLTRSLEHLGYVVLACSLRRARVHKLEILEPPGEGDLPDASPDEETEPTIPMAVQPFEEEPDQGEEARSDDTLARDPARIQGSGTSHRYPRGKP